MDQALARLIARDQELARERAKLVPEPAAPDPLKVALAMPDVFVAHSPELEAKRLADEQRLKREAEREHMTKWRANMQRFAPIAKWESAFTADPTDATWPATQLVADWLAGGCKKHLVLSGAVGCGKTLAAAYAVKQWVEPGANFAPVSWLRPNDVVSAVMHSWDKEAPRLCRYIVVDDMGRETKGDFAEAMCDLLERRGHTLIVTTNLTAVSIDSGKTFKGRYDERLLSRLRDTCTRLPVPGGDRRSKEGEF